MPHGYPPWSGIKRDTIFALPLDLGELAARLGSIVTFDRRGDVIYLEDFSRGYPLWGVAEYGTGAAIELTTKRALSPPFSMSLITGNDGAKAAKMTYQVAYPALSKIALEYAFTLHVNLVYHRFDFLHRDGSTAYHYGVRLDVQNGKLAVREPGPVWTEFASGLNLKSDEWVFHVGKLVEDIENNAYCRFILDDVSYLLSDYEPYSESETTVPYIEAAILTEGPAGSNVETFVDNIIITQNED